MGKYAILTSGGDSPGMNCAIRAYTRTMLYLGHEVIGIQRGYSGLLNKDFLNLNASSVGNIIQRGGTFLQSSRCLKFHEKKFRKAAAQKLEEENIKGLCVVGGDGSFKGAFALHNDFNVPVVGIPGTIDNDISGTEYTIGHDTAVQTAVEAVDKIRDTAFSHDRVFLIEVMGRNSASLALKVGLCTGAENVIVPGNEIPYKEIADKIKKGEERGKKGSILIVAEGGNEGRSYSIQSELQNRFNINSKVCILGHIQRGGSPSAMDRLIATEMGALAAKELLDFKKPMVTTYTNGQVGLTPFPQCLTGKEESSTSEIELTKVLSI